MGPLPRGPRGRFAEYLAVVRVLLGLRLVLGAPTLVLDESVNARSVSDPLHQVAMSANDIVTSGAKPLLFLDYYVTSKLNIDLAQKVIKGILDGCRQSDCILLRGEESGVKMLMMPTWDIQINTT
ncbi:Phosphoribosylformylglycinamidine cyclo-ligase, chloroplastic [Hordeum vulgare]|nr:Phosphoribosylformylglycinamidine cyclo-ligase, chloroplastic [Hordeum vulgare]